MDTAPGTLPEESIQHPRKSGLAFPVVGLGASAGGMAAALTFFEHLPASTGMAFVVVLHLSRDHESSAAQIFQRATGMQVVQVTESMPIQANHVYVIAPGLHLAMDDGHLKVGPLERPSGKPVAIDLFFRTLARAHGERAVAVVLSGTGSDGAVGLADLKAEGGVVFVQSPDDAQYDGMPHAAIATRLVDFVLPVAEIPDKLIEVWENARNIQLPQPQDVPSALVKPVDPLAKPLAEAALKDIMSLLHDRTGNDFRHYKRATVLRRLERRMQVTRQPTLMAYRDHLENNARETEPLLQDMLISVTSFFRDRDAFESLEREVAVHMKRPSVPSQFRAWCVGCATGEEAYSLAMLVNDHVPEGRDLSIQIFGSDIDDRALAAARQGVYPDAIATDVPPTRLRQYFQSEPGSYRVRKSLREQIMFAKHNVLRDPPFSRLDVICCRNLLIYLEREVQAEVLEIFHFALNPGGLLLLGSAESADAHPHLFSPLGKKSRIYRAEPATYPRADLPCLRPAVMQVAAPPPSDAYRPLPFAPAQLHEQVLKRQVPPSVLVDAHRQVLHIDGGASRYLRMPEGTPAKDVLELVQPAYEPSLRIALMHAMRTGGSVAVRPVSIAGKSSWLRISVRPSGDPTSGTGVFVVFFDELETDLSADADAGPHTGLAEISILEQEVQRLNQQLMGTMGDSATSSEALRASNEELQSINEELRSATEELETSKEELQSVNEELSTVNFELKRKVDEAAKINDDLTNLIVSMDIATVFVDRAMRIKRFTPRASDVFNILGTDVGRPLLDLTHRLHYDDLEQEVSLVLTRLQTVEREVQAEGGLWYLVRISPYRLGEDRIDGAVINLIDVTERRRAQEQLRAREERARVVAENTRDYAIVTLDLEGKVTSWNRGAEEMFGLSEAEMLGVDFRRVYLPEDRASGQLDHDMQLARESGRTLDERWMVRKDGGRIYASSIVTPFSDPSAPGYALIARDLTERQRLDKQREELLVAEKRLRSQLEAAHATRSEFLAIMSHELKNPLNLIMLNAEILIRSKPVQGAAPLARAAEIIRRTVHGQSQIIDDLLDLSRLNTGKLTIRGGPVDCRPLIERIIDAVMPEAQSREVELSVQIGDAVVFGDAIRIEQIVWNLVSNALKFTGAGGRIDVTLTCDSQWATLQVRDTGSGIEAEKLERIFNMFEQGQGTSRTRSMGGLGIGLAIVRQLVELHRGQVVAHSDGIGKGACFTVTLPLYDGALIDRPLDGDVNVRGKRVLVVDDDVDAASALCALLQSEGALTDMAPGGKEASRLAAAHDYDLLVSDLAMPDMDGLQLIRELRGNAKTSTLPAVALSGFWRSGDQAESLAAGYHFHLSKPLSLDALYAVLSRLPNNDFRA